MLEEMPLFADLHLGVEFVVVEPDEALRKGGPPASWCWRRTESARRRNAGNRRESFRYPSPGFWTLALRSLAYGIRVREVLQSA